MIDLNEIRITGNLVADPVTRPAGETTVTNARLIYNRSTKNKQTGEWEPGEPFGLDLQVWGAYGESFAKKARKGTRVLFCGSLAPNNYDRKEDGTKHFGVRVQVDRFQIVAQPGSRPAPAKKSQPRRRSAAAAA